MEPGSSVSNPDNLPDRSDFIDWLKCRINWLESVVIYQEMMVTKLLIRQRHLERLSPQLPSTAALVNHYESLVGTYKRMLAYTRLSHRRVLMDLDQIRKYSSVETRIQA